ncbi:FCS-Like Zinc finger 10-like isoform X2 [Cornus florida]|uniref:FCS-Like Zinc finger 10-like isoform X2 n=1 Tax=Cornus florida TaxID=4283 RepID=UPI0028A2D0FF|nr:FCS-Like Zinc finger 10-like isoform X2 [Cornus florida]
MQAPKHLSFDIWVRACGKISRGFGGFEMMLRKRTRSKEKDQHMDHLISDANSESFLVQKHKTNSFFTVPGLFVGLGNNGSESDSVWSPTSPLDFMFFPNLGSPSRSPSSTQEGHQNRWNCNKVGLSIIDCLDNNGKQSGKVLRSYDSKSILCGPQMRIKIPNFGGDNGSFEAPNSLPKNYANFPCTQIKSSNLLIGNSDVLFGNGETPLEHEPFGKILSCSLDSGRSGMHLSSLTNHSTNSSSEGYHLESGTKPVISPPQLIGGRQNLGSSLGTKLNLFPVSDGFDHNSLVGSSASEIELSEDYTCVRTHGPNPKTTHIFCDCILECHNNESTKFSKKEEKEIGLPPAVAVKCCEVPILYPSSDFLSFCYSCKKKLEGEDIYMYRGEKAFCSWGCRSEEILIEEATEKIIDNSSESTPNSNDCEELFETGMFITE